MPSALHLFLFSIVVFLGSHGANSQPRALHLPIRKDNVTLQYYTSFEVGSSEVGSAQVNVVYAVIDLGAQFLWFNCDDGYNSSSYNPVRCGSSKCKIAKGTACLGCSGAPRPGCTNNTCALFAYNPFNDSLVTAGLGEDVIDVYETDGRSVLLQINVPSFPFACADSDHLNGLAKGTKGILGLGRTQIALPMQLASKFKLKPKFALCVPSSTERGFGDIFIGGGPYYMLPYPKDASELLITTPLIINPVSTAPLYSEGDPSDEYFIGVNSIKIGGKVVKFKTSLLSIDKKGFGGTKISTINPYTTLHTSIYKAVVKDFVNKAASRKITRVASVAPFGACFSSKTIASTESGPGVPTIDLVLQNKSVYWRIYGANSMVKVKENVVCLGFVDGGSRPRTSIVIGGHQLEDNLLEFDLASSKLGFSSSLLLRNTSCSHSRIF
ncbi:basic 7S globulin-like [Fagus crenata]